MVELIPYDRPRGEVHDLARLDSLSADRCHILCVSERTLYVLHNVASSDIAFESRYAVELTEAGYYAVSELDDEYDLYRAVVNAMQLEVLTMDCDIGGGLQAIAEALSDLELNISCGCGCGGSGTLPCIQDVPNDGLLGPPNQIQANPASDPPPEGFATWEEYFDYKCKAAEFIWDLYRKNMVMIKNFEFVALTAAIVGPVASGIAGVLPAVFTPAGFVVFVTSIVAIGVTAGASFIYMGQMIDEWDANHDEIVCSMYNAGTSVEAVAGLADALEDAIQAILVWGALEGVADIIAELLGTAFGALTGNSLVEPLFQTAVAVTNFDADCSECETQAGDLFLTQLYQPYNVLIHGDEITALDDAPATGYKVQNSGTQIYLEFTTIGAVSNWEWSGYIKSPDHPAETLNMVAHLDRWNGSSWDTEHTWGPEEYDSDEWNYFAFDVDDEALLASTLYRMQFTLQDFNKYAWWRSIVGATV